MVDLHVPSVPVGQRFLRYKTGGSLRLAVCAGAPWHIGMAVSAEFAAQMRAEAQKGVATPAWGGWGVGVECGEA